MSKSTDSAAPHAKKINFKPWLRKTLVVFGALLIFGLGWGIGNGRVSFKAHQGLQKDLPTSLDYSSVTEVYRALRNNFDGTLETNALTDGMKEGLVQAAGDPYTEYLNRDRYKEFNEELTGSFTGVGAELSQDADGNIQVVAPIDGFPAAKAGLRPKDIIVKIDDQTTSGMTVSEAVSKIRGPKGTTVKLTVIRDSKELNFTIERDNINIPSVTAKVEDGIGYLKISRFSDDTTELAQKAALDFKRQNVTGVVLDMRSNPGGLTNAAVSVSSLWLPKGTTIMTERRGGVVMSTQKAEGNAILQGMPTVVLINEGSASSSEITAGALQDNGAATLVGEKTYGKGSVQQLIKLKAGGVLKVTIARWYTPNGKNIDKEGIEPDKKVTITEDDVKNGHDPQKAAALDILNQ